MEAVFLEQTIEYRFKNKDLLKEALTHRSYLNERPTWGLPHNERLEFLGDAVLELIITEELFNRYPEEQEGQLTSLRSALVNYQMLAKVGREITLENFVLLSRGEAKDLGRGREVIVANAFEALIGALYLDGGYDATKQFVNHFVMAHLDEVMKYKLYKDAKSLLQEKSQNDWKITPTYKVLEESGPDHQKNFTVGVYVGEKLLARGQGPAKQDAETDAARRALQSLNE